MPVDPSIGRNADAIKITWHHFEKHALGCDKCALVLIQLRTDPDHHDRPFLRHRERHDACCEAGQKVLKPWITAVTEQVRRFTGARLTRSGGAVE